MKNNFFAASLVIGLAYMLIIGVYTLGRVGLTEPIPIHFDISGEADLFAPAVIAVLICPVIAFAVAFLLDRKLNGADPSVSRQLLICHIISILVVVGVQTIICLHAESASFAYVDVVLALVGVIIAIVFNGISTLPRNTAVGVRNRWSMLSEENWYFVQRFSGRLGVVVGIIIAVSAVILGNGLSMLILFLCLIALLVLGTLFYSFHLAKRTERKNG